MSNILDSSGNLDPTGVLNATSAAVRLVGTVLNVAPAVSKAINDHSRSAGGNSGESDVTGASTNAAAPVTAAQIQSLALQRVDPERETRAYETVNYVLRTIGSRILEARMVNMDALAKALTAATAHIEVKLFSGETNRLFQSLARKLNDNSLVNSVFTSIYLIGFLTAELTGSLPHYKREYPALGPLLVQQMMRAAIGEDAFRENQTANLNSYQTVATTAGLLRPTDIGYSIFPDFPSFSPTRYSSKGMMDRANHKGVLEKLVKHFDQHGFPQPLQGRDVGPIRDWRFLAGDSNSRAYEVDKADKHIGTNFGRVLYWLICSAHRMPSGMAVVGYMDQHIALIRFLGPRFGYRVIETRSDLNVSGPHLLMNKKLRAVFDTWVIIMPSETLINERRMILEATNQAPAPVMQQPQVTMPATQSPPPYNISQTAPQQHNFAPVVVPIQTAQPNFPGSPASGGGRQSISSESSSQIHRPGPSTSYTQSLNAGTPSEQLTELENLYISTLLPSCNDFIASPPGEINALKKEYFRLTESLQTAVLFRIDAVDPGSDDMARMKRKALVDDVQGTMARLDNIYREASKVSSPPSRPTSMASLPSLRPTTTADQSFSINDGLPAELAAPSMLPGGDLPEVVPAAAGSEGVSGQSVIPESVSVASPSNYTIATPSVSTPPTGASSPQNTPISPISVQPRPSVVRRKAPPPPKKVILAKALFDFEAEEEGGEELNFSEGDIIEIVEKNKTLEEDGWCRARVKGQKRIGLAPLDYLEELPNQPSGPPPRSSRMSSMTASEPILEQTEQPPSGPPPPKTTIPDAKSDTNVSATSQNPQPAPNAIRPQTESPSLPQHSQIQNSAASASAYSPPLSPPPNHSPSAYTASGIGSPSAQSTNHVSQAHDPHSVRPSSFHNPTGPASVGSIGNSPGSQPIVSALSSAAQYSGNRPPEHYTYPVHSSSLYNRPATRPHAQYSQNNSIGLGDMLGIASSTPALVDAGANILSTIHGRTHLSGAHQSNSGTHQYPHANQYHHGNGSGGPNSLYHNHYNNQYPGSMNFPANDDMAQTLNNLTSIMANNNQSGPLQSGNSSSGAPNNNGYGYSPSNNIGSTSPPLDQLTSIAGSGPGTDPSIFATVPSSNSPQSPYDPISMGGGGISPFTSFSLPTPSVSPFDPGNTSPLAALSQSPGPVPSNNTGSPDGALSPFASLATPDVGVTYFGATEVTPNLSPFASLATPDPAILNAQSSSNVDIISSPLASLALVDPSITDQGYFNPSLTTTAMVDTSNSTGVSPFAGLANSSTTVTTTTMTTDTQTDAVSPFAGLTDTSTTQTTIVTSTTTDSQSGGSGTGFLDQSSMNFSTTTTTDLDTSSATGGGWNTTDFTSTDSNSYAYSDSFQF